MPSWLVDDPTTVLFVLALLALPLGVFWWIRRGDDFGKNKLNWFKGLLGRRMTPNQFCAMGLTIIGVIAVLTLVSYLFVETDNKRIRRAVKEMSAGVKEQNIDKIFSHVSERFNLMGQGKESYRPVVERHIRNGDITEISVWDFEEAKISDSKKDGTIEFMFRPKGTMTQAWYRCVATFVRDPDGKWRLATFRVFEPQIDPATGQSVYPR